MEKREHKLSKYMKSLFRKNPISYLGWLGILGVFGIFMCSWVLVPFAICFTFFAYRNMVADEMFWKNVRQSAARAFWSVFIFDLVSLIFLYVRSFMAVADPQYQYQELIVQGDTITWGAFSFTQFAVGYWGFLLGIILILLVFSISMLRFRHREKKALKAQEELA